MSDSKRELDVLATPADDQPTAKRAKTEDAETAGVLEDADKSAVAAQAADVKAENDEEDEDELIPLPVSTTRSAVKKGQECPYLDTILRQVTSVTAAHPSSCHPSSRQVHHVLPHCCCMINNRLRFKFIDS
jgi:hypothetical protein